MARFRDVFGEEPRLLVRAPGRVNLLGEHVDYNEGWVLPAAIDRAVWLAASPRADASVEIHAVDLGRKVAFRTDDVATKLDLRGESLPAWARYPAGVAWALQTRGFPVAGARVSFSSDVPIGAGLSSSAAVEVAFATMWKAWGERPIDALELAQLCQRAENAYVGVQCGLMDQFASVHGRAGHALLFDCRALTSELVPLPRDTVIVIADTKVRRELGRSEFNRRRSECEAAVRILSEVRPGIRSLRDVTPEELRFRADLLPETVRRRARHVVEEIARVRAAIPAIRSGDAAAMGEAMLASHRSGRDLYEVSCFELDVLVDSAVATEGCYGARLTGAGFGGCTVSLVAAGTAEGFTRELARAYERETRTVPELWICHADDGASVVSAD